MKIINIYSLVAVKRFGLFLACLLFAPFFVKTAIADIAVGKITAVRGSVVLKKPGQSLPVRVLTEGQTIAIADVVETETGGLAQIQLADESLLMLSSGSAVRISQFSLDEDQNRRTAHVTVLRGKARCVIYKRRSQESIFQVDTPTARLTIDDLADFVVDSYPEQTEVAVLKEAIRAKNSNELVVGEVRLEENQQTIVMEKRPPELPQLLKKSKRSLIIKQFRFY